ncbi:MAG: NBR1-Ig-like domain-containing protein [Gemmatales bacterium]|nr:NBR1-Ig-like domain-containing protein [Gemmatales bacterium]MDW8224095.1 NBR1-Ig-like domain-containing protein [Gemmatales bacterium]
MRWEVDNVEAVYFNGEGTVGYGSRQVCPTTSTNYNLAVVKNGQTTNYSVVINVSEPAVVDNSAYVADITIPDGMILIPGQTFTKTWRVRNSGNTTWSTGYQLVYVSGERFGASAATPLKAEVAPGRQVDLDLVLKAPQRSGTYTGVFMLRNADGKLFGTKLTVVVKVPTFVVTYMEIDPAKPIQRQPIKLRVYYDLVGNLDEYHARFNGEVLLRDSRGQIVERVTYDKSNATFLPDAEALRKDPNFRKWVLTIRNVSFRGWSDAATIEVWLRPLGSGSGTEYIKASLRTSIQADPAAVTRCASFISKKLASVAPSKLAWVLVGTGTATRLATCESVNCVAWEIAQLIARAGGDIARTILAMLNINNMTGAEDCYRLVQ